MTIFSGVQIATIVVAIAGEHKKSPTAATNALTTTLIGTGSLLMKQLVLDIGPEFLQDLRHSIGGDLG